MTPKRAGRDSEIATLAPVANGCGCFLITVTGGRNFNGVYEQLVGQLGRKGKSNG